MIVVALVTLISSQYSSCFFFLLLGTTVSVEAVDPVFQSEMVEMLKQTGRPEMVVGWYHSVRWMLDFTLLAVAPYCIGLACFLHQSLNDIFSLLISILALVVG
jgi:JAB1/Mov34/MPN/PAD-1 ubiquitin protease